MEPNNSKYEIRSQEVQELLGNVPAWIIRWGTFVVFFVLVMLFVLSQYLCYPDVINSQITLTANIPPAEMKANSDGAINQILVTEHQTVVKGQLMAVIQSAANYADILWLKDTLPADFSVDVVLQQSFKGIGLELGRVQSSYASYVNSLEEYQGFVDVDYFRKKSNATKREISRHQMYIDNLDKQIKVLEREFGLNCGKYKRDSLLFVQDVISATDLEKSEEEKLSSLYDLRYEESEKSEAKIEISKLEQDLLELELQLKQQNQAIYSALKAKFETLKGTIAQWEKDFLIVAPFNGKVSLSKVWTRNQYVKEGEVVVTVLPDEYSSIVGRVTLQPVGAGKIDIRDRVIIRFDNYPYLEFGVVTGKVASMSLTPDNGIYYATVKLDSANLVTSYNTQLNFSQGMLGSAEIITESRSLFQRISDPLRSAAKLQQMYRETEDNN